MMAHWEERVTKEQRAEISKATLAFRNKQRRSRDDEHVLYAALTDNGMTPEEADEWINLELENY